MDLPTPNRDFGRMKARQIQFGGLNPGQLAFCQPDSEGKPIILWKGAMLGSKLPRDIMWQEFHKRKHAFAACFDATYKFGPKPLRASDQSKQANEQIMNLMREAKQKIKVKKNSGTGAIFGLIELPHLDVATLSKYEKGDRLPVHQDNEREHANDAIVSMSFGSRATMVIHRNDFNRSELFRFHLDDGDLLIFDRFLYHSIEEITGPRTNITFRSWKKEWYRPEGFSKKRKIMSPEDNATV